MALSHFAFAPEDVPPDIREAWDRAAPRLGCFASRLHYRASVSSTNDVAMRLAEVGAVEGTTCLADAQTAGRGRHGREWFSPAGAGVYVSVVLRPYRFCRSRQSADWITSRLTVTAAVALAEGVRVSTGLPVELKWPNDLVVERRKVAGILAEMATTGTDHPAVVIGIGINLRPAAYPPDLATSATAVEVELGRPVDRALVVTETLAALARRYDELRDGTFDAILDAWRGFARALPGSAIEWDGPHGPLRGQAIDIDRNGALIARVGDAITRLVAGEVRWR